MDDLVHFAFESDPTNSYPVCGEISDIYRYSSDTKVANCPKCWDRLTKFVREMSEVCIDNYETDDGARMEAWQDEALELMGKGNRQ